jgi:hypothetical protein
VVNTKTVVSAIIGFCLAWSLTLEAQWPKFIDKTLPRDAQGNVRMDAPTPRTADGKPDFSGVWMRANSGPPRQGGPGRGRGREGAGGAQPGAGGGGAAPGRGAGAEGGGRGATAGVQLEPPTAPFPYDPNGPPVATFFEAGGNIPGNLPYTPWALALKKERMASQSKENPDANCMPMGFLQFHQQPQPRKILQTPQMILIEYEANYGIRHIYIDGRPLPPQGEPQPWWYGYSVGRWEGDTLVVTTNNLRGAEDSVQDGWLDVNGSPYSREAIMTERIRRLSVGQLQIDTTIEDKKAYTKPFTVRVDQRLMPDQEMIEFICNENQQFRRRVKID